jgi:hypothetical protein
MKRIIVTPLNVVDSVLLDKKLASIPRLRKMAVEAYLISISGNHSSKGRLAMEAYASISEEVVEAARRHGVELVLGTVRTKRTTEVRRSRDDLLGLQLEAAAGFASHPTLCAWRDQDEVAIVFFS